MTARDDQAHAYADAQIAPQLPTLDDFIPDHGGPVTSHDVFTLVEDAFAAGWDAAAKQVTADLT